MRLFKSGSLFVAMLSTFVVSTQSFAIEVGQNAPRVDLVQVQADGGEISDGITSRNSGQNFTILEFFSVTCGPCTRNLPYMAQLSKETGSNTVTRLIGIDRDEDAIRTYVKQHRDTIQFPVALDTKRVAKNAYDILYTPTTFVIDANDKVIYKKIGTFNSSDVENIKALVK